MYVSVRPRETLVSDFSNGDKEILYTYLSEL